MADLHALYRPDLKGVWIQSGLDRMSLPIRKIMAPMGFHVSRRRVELATCEF
jgi:hypothetical protein